jgi:hypothetical protein
MSSPIGRNTFLRCARYDLELDKFVLVNPNFIYNSICNKTDNTLYRTVDTLHELTFDPGFFIYLCLTYVKLLRQLTVRPRLS